MVYLNRIYTKTGDDGTTALGDGTRLSKTHARITAYGGVDELNAVLGLACLHAPSTGFATPLRQIQNDLFDLGADLCIPETDAPTDYPPLRVTTRQVEQLEQWIDAATAKLEPLTSFTLPGGTPLAAHFHLARTVCRRVEIGVVRLAETESINPLVLQYLNRLSDLLFAWARLANDNGRGDVLWIPGGKAE
ncbi:cob(I)yrinic acid a,c-diamide adenosyltransferase [bacterium]|nr:cob(I)yrinic acid a,c-diamide adenosyltransferase [bacterium]